MRALKTWAVALGIVAPAAQAESNNIEIYGLLDLGITTLDHAKPFDPSLGTVPMTNKLATDRVSSVVSGNLQTSRIGFRGQEDLGNGLSVIFTLESHINANNGTLGAGASATGDKSGSYQVGDSSCQGQLFCRQAWIGLQGDFGTFSLGRQYAFTYDIISAYDPLNASNSFDGAGATQQGGGNTRDVRIDNSAKYTTRINNVNLGVEYGFGGVPERPSAGAFLGVSLGYETGPFSIQGAWQRKTDSQIWSATSPNLNTVYDTDTGTFLLAVKYRMDNTLLHAGYQQIYFDTGSNALCVPGADFVCGANKRYDGKRTKLWFSGVTYAATSRLKLIGGAYDLHQFAFQTGSASMADGHQRDLSLLMDYQLSKRTDLYAGVHHTALSGGNAYGFLKTSFNLFATGLKVAF